MKPSRIIKHFSKTKKDINYLYDLKQISKLIYTPKFNVFFLNEIVSDVLMTYDLFGSILDFFKNQLMKWPGKQENW